MKQYLDVQLIHVWFIAMEWQCQCGDSESSAEIVYEHPHSIEKTDWNTRHIICSPGELIALVYPLKSPSCDHTWGWRHRIWARLEDWDPSGLKLKSSALDYPEHSVTQLNNVLTDDHMLAARLTTSRWNEQLNYSLLSSPSSNYMNRMTTTSSVGFLDQLLSAWMQHAVSYFGENTDWD